VVALEKFVPFARPSSALLWRVVTGASCRLRVAAQEECSITYNYLAKHTGKRRRGASVSAGILTRDCSSPRRLVWSLAVLAVS